MQLSRRALLGTAVGGTVVAVGTAVGLLAPLPAGAGLQSFSAREYKTLEAITRALFPAGVLGPGADDVQVANKLDTHLASFYARERMLLKLMMRLVEQRPYLEGRGGFSTLPEADRVELLKRWEANGDIFGLGVNAIRVLCAMYFFQDARVLSAVGWGLGCDDVAAGVPG